MYLCTEHHIIITYSLDMYALIINGPKSILYKIKQSGSANTTEYQFHEFHNFLQNTNYSPLL